MFENVKKNFGFGCMRLPMKENEVDYAELSKMVDTFIGNGFNYFDTALTDKLTGAYFKSESDVRPFFESQLRVCGKESG